MILSFFLFICTNAAERMWNDVISVEEGWRYHSSVSITGPQFPIFTHIRLLKSLDTQKRYKFRFRCKKNHGVK
jgi:hypothetical protein